MPETAAHPPLLTHQRYRLVLPSYAAHPAAHPADVLLSLTAAHVTGTGPHVAGIILTDARETVG